MSNWLTPSSLRRRPSGTPGVNSRTLPGSVKPSRPDPRRSGVLQWQVWRQPAVLLIAILGVDAAAAASLLLNVATLSPNATDLTRSVVLIALCILFEEVARGIARLRFRLVQTSYIDMTSVWIFAGLVAVSTSYVLVTVIVIRIYLWTRSVRRQGGHGYRFLVSTATQVLSVQAAAGAIGAAGDVDWLSTPVSQVVLALVVYTVTNRLLILLVMSLASRRVVAGVFPGSWEDNALELASLSLGSLTGVAMAISPPFAVLVVLPTFVLQRGALAREFEEAASLDAKTGLLNATAWQQLARREMSRAARERTAAAVLIVDLDLFKDVNDRFGHVVGDAALKRVAECLQEELRDYDTVGRFGGEEFVAVLPEVDEVEAAVIAERLRARIKSTLIRDLADGAAPADDETSLSGSFGVACFPEHGTELETLLIGADSALYRAKARGRNRVEFADGRNPDQALVDH